VQAKNLEIQRITKQMESDASFIYSPSRRLPMFPLEEGFGEPWFPMSVHHTLFKIGRTWRETAAVFMWRVGFGRVKPKLERPFHLSFFTKTTQTRFHRFSCVRMRYSEEGPESASKLGNKRVSSVFEVVHPAGVEPTTFGFGGHTPTEQTFGCC